jgi:hypothetical protein
MKTFMYKRRFIFFPLIGIAFLALVSFVVMQLWNHLLPDILNVTTITFWQALGLFILSKILFGFGRGGGHMGPPWMRGGMGRRFGNMSPEEKQKFKEAMKNRMCWKGNDQNTAFSPENAEPPAPGA